MLHKSLYFIQPAGCGYRYIAQFTVAGDVMETIADYNLEHLKYTIGFVMRYALIPDEGVNLRFDAGFSRHGGSIYFQVSEAF